MNFDGIIDVYIIEGVQGLDYCHHLKNNSVNNVTNNSRDLRIVGLLNIFILFRKKSPLDSADLLTSKTGF